MSIEHNKALDRRFYEEVWNRGNLAALEELRDVNFDDHDEPAPTATLTSLEHALSLIHI